MRTILAAWALVIASVCLVALGGATRAEALPEYAVLTGEPCASCHISPSGGGLRTPRGTAWVAGGRPGAVPDLSAALDLLGVRLTADETAYETVPGTIPDAAPLSMKPASAEALRQWLSQYGGN